MIRELEQQYIRLKWLMTIRLIVITISLLLGVLLIGGSDFYSYIVFYYFISILYVIFILKSTHYVFFGIFQIFIDLLAVTAIVIIADPIESIFPNLYIVVIVLSNIMYIRHAGLITVALSILLYLGTVIFSYYDKPNYVAAFKDYGIYVVYIEITIFICVGYLAHYLSSLIRKQTLELKQLEKESDYVFHHIKSGVFLVNKDDFVYYANSFATSILSCTENNLIDVKWQQILNIDSISSVEKKNELEIGNEIELVAFDFNGKEIPLAITFSPINSPKSVDDYYIVLFRDLVDQKNSEQTLLESERLRTIVELSSSIAHEIGNPLASISGSAELLEMKLDDPDQKKHLEVISWFLLTKIKLNRSCLIWGLMPCKLCQRVGSLNFKSKLMKKINLLLQKLRTTDVVFLMKFVEKCSILFIPQNKRALGLDSMFLKALLKATKEKLMLNLKLEKVPLFLFHYL